MRKRIIGLLFLYLGVATCASAQTGSIIPPIEGIIAGMAQARAENQAHFRAYIVTRDYKLFGKESTKTKSQVIADISFIPPATKTYMIQTTNGSGFGETVVRRMLMSEVEIARDYTATDFSPDNYDFRFILEENAGGRRCYVLELLPKRKDKNLLQGKIWVDAATYLPQRIEGVPVKTPSWWLRSLRFELSYSDVGGMWLQTALEATATVRILGPHTMVSRDVKYQLGDQDVAARLKQVLEQMPDGSYSVGPRISRPYINQGLLNLCEQGKDQHYSDSDSLSHLTYSNCAGPARYPLRPDRSASGAR